MFNMSRFLRRFRDNERGAAALETIIIIPLMFWAYLSMYSYFHAYRTHALNIKTAYAIGDVISRQTTPIDQAYMNGVHELAAYMSWTSRDSFAIRITSIVYDEESNEYRSDWSQAKGWKQPLSNGEVNNLRDDLPIMPDGERLVLVETFKDYDPPFKMGLSDHEVHNFVFTRPRYAPRVLWDDGTNGS